MPYRLLAVLGVLCLLAFACGGGEEAQPTPTPSPAVIRPSPTPEPTPSPTPIPTPTPAPLRILFTSDRERGGTYLMDGDGSNVVRIGSILGGLGVYDNIWSPDGSKVAFFKCLEGPSNDSELHVVNADGTEEANLSNHPSPDVIVCNTAAPDGTEGWAAAFDPDAVDEPWLTPTGDPCQGEPAG